MRRKDNIAFLGTGLDAAFIRRLADEIHSTYATILQNRRDAFAARSDSVEFRATLELQLREDPSDVTLRRKLLYLHLVDLDNPAAAVKFLDAADAQEESVKTNLPLAATSVERLSKDSALKLAEWYMGLLDQADNGGKELVAARAQTYYRRFFELHGDRDDALTTRATLGLEKLGGDVTEMIAVATSTSSSQTPATKTPSSPDTPTSPRFASLGLKRNELTDVALAEFVVANPEITQIRFETIGTVDKITSLQPLQRLTKLERLELHQAEKITDLTPLAKLTNLTVLKMTHMEAGDLSPLANLTKLSVLDLSFSKQVSDITPIGRLVNMYELSLNDCEGITDIAPLAKLTNVVNIALRNCSAIHDFSPLEKLAKNLTTLSVQQCHNLAARSLIALTKLTELNISGCDKINDNDLTLLSQRLKNCTIHR